MTCSHGGAFSPTDHRKKCAPVVPNHLNCFDNKIFCFSS